MLPGNIPTHCMYPWSCISKEYRTRYRCTKNQIDTIHDSIVDIRGNFPFRSNQHSWKYGDASAWAAKRVWMCKVRYFDVSKLAIRCLATYASMPPSWIPSCWGWFRVIKHGKIGTSTHQRRVCIIPTRHKIWYRYLVPGIKYWWYARLNTGAWYARWWRFFHVSKLFCEQTQAGYTKKVKKIWNDTQLPEVRMKNKPMAWGFCTKLYASKCVCSLFRVSILFSACTLEPTPRVTTCY